MSVFENITPIYAQALAEIHRKCFEVYWDEKAFLDLILLPTSVGLVCDKGFILCSKVLDEAEILTVCVLPDSRRQGIASSLLSQMADELKKQGIKNLFLDVDEQNKSAISLYEKNGFLFVSRRKGYYHTKNGVSDALIYKKEL